jgi:hypothetical protein
MVSAADFFQGDIRGVIDHYLAEKDLDGFHDPQDRLASKLESVADELRADKYQARAGVPYRHLDPDDVHGRFGGNEHYRLIQMALHRVVNRYYDKNARITVENESLAFTSSISTHSFHGPGHSEKELHPDIFVEMESGETGMAEDKTIIVECETSKSNLLTNDLRLAAYNLLREGNTDRNQLMIYLAFPTALKGAVEKPAWANDLWFFDTGVDN